MSAINLIPWGQRVCFIGTTPYGDNELLHWSTDRTLDDGVNTCFLGSHATTFLNMISRADHLLENGMYFTWHKDGRFIVDAAGWHEWRVSLNLQPNQDHPTEPYPINPFEESVCSTNESTPLLPNFKIL